MKKHEKGTVKVNFMCQFDWVTRCPDTWSNIVLGVSVRVFSDEINIGIDGLSKADCPPQCGWASSNQLMACIDKKADLQGVRQNSCLTADLGHFFPLLWNSN